MSAILVQEQSIANTLARLSKARTFIKQGHYDLADTIIAEEHVKLTKIFMETHNEI